MGHHDAIDQRLLSLDKVFHAHNEFLVDPMNLVQTYGLFLLIESSQNEYLIHIPSMWVDLSLGHKSLT